MTTTPSTTPRRAPRRSKASKADPKKTSKKPKRRKKPVTRNMYVFIDLAKNPMLILAYARRKEVHFLIRRYLKRPDNIQIFHSAALIRELENEYGAVLCWNHEFKFGIKFKHPITKNRFIADHIKYMNMTYYAWLKITDINAFNRWIDLLHEHGIDTHYDGIVE